MRIAMSPPTSAVPTPKQRAERARLRGTVEREAGVRLHEEQQRRSPTYAIFCSGLYLRGRRGACREGRGSTARSRTSAPRFSGLRQEVAEVALPTSACPVTTAELPDERVPDAARRGR